MLLFGPNSGKTGQLKEVDTDEGYGLISVGE